MNPICHVQPGGEVVMSTRLEDGRVYRVCGGRPHRGCVVAQELYRVMQWSRGHEKTIAAFERALQ